MLLNSKDRLGHMFRSEHTINVTCPLTQFTFTFLISTPFPPAAAQPWQLLWSGGCLRPLDPAVTQHTPPAPASVECVRVCMPVCAWASGCVYVTLLLRASVKMFFGSWGPAGWAIHLLSAAGNPAASVTAGKSLFKTGHMERGWDWFDCGHRTHTWIHSHPMPF